MNGLKDDKSHTHFMGCTVFVIFLAKLQVLFHDNALSRTFISKTFQIRVPVN